MDSVIDMLVKQNMLLTGQVYSLHSLDESLNFMKYLVRFNVSSEVTSQLIYLLTEYNPKKKVSTILVPKDNMIDLVNSDVKTAAFQDLKNEVQKIYDKDGRIFSSLLYFAKPVDGKYVSWDGQRLTNDDIPSLMSVANRLFIQSSFNAVATLPFASHSIGDYSIKAFALAYHWKQFDRLGKLTPPHIHVAFAAVMN